MQSIEKALDNFGTTVKTVVFYQLEKEYGIKKDQIPNHIDLFAKIIDAFFGVGSKKIRDSILHELRISTGIVELDKYDLVSAVKEFRHEIQRSI